MKEVKYIALRITVVVGTKGKNIRQDYPINVRVSPDESELSLETIFLCFQIRSIDKNRFSSAPVGQLSEEKMQEIETAIPYCLGL